MDNPLYSLIIPTLNEDKLIVHALSSIASELGEDAPRTEMIIVDDGTDDLPGVLKKDEWPFFRVSVLRNTVPKGKGRSIARGFMEASGEVVGFIDADLSVSARHIRPALDIVHRKGFDMCIGVRTEKRTSRQPVPSAFLGWLLSLISALLFFGWSNRIKDTQCGFKFFRAETARELYSDLVASDGLSDLEILVKARRKGYKIYEYAVVSTNRVESKRKLGRILWREAASLMRLMKKYV